MRETNVSDDLLDDFKNIDVTAAFDPFISPLESQLTDVECLLKNELNILKQMKKVLNELNQEITTQRFKSEAKPKPSKTTEKAKEEAMKLLKSGAISFDNASDRHVFKRKTKESEGYGYEPEEAPIKNKKPNLYDSFVFGEKLNPITAPPPNKISREPLPSDVPNTSQLGSSFGIDEQHKDVKPYAAGHSHKVPPPAHYSNREDYSSRKQGPLTIYISCNDITEVLVRDILEPYGPITNIRLDERKSYGFVTLNSTEMVEKALQLDNTRYDNHRLRVNYARRQYKNPLPPPLPSNEPEPGDRYQQRSHDNYSRSDNKKLEPPTPQSDANLRNLVDYGDVDQ